MTDAYSWLKVLHVLSATVLFGTGLGTAFQMWMAHLSGDPRSIATVSRSVVMADFLFTTPAVIAQPASGIALMWLAGLDPLSSWCGCRSGSGTWPAKRLRRELRFPQNTAAA
jgi:uncharacterized membrane protein